MILLLTINLNFLVKYYMPIALFVLFINEKHKFYQSVKQGLISECICNFYAKRFDKTINSITQTNLNKFKTILQPHEN